MLPVCDYSDTLYSGGYAKYPNKYATPFQTVCGTISRYYQELTNSPMAIDTIEAGWGIGAVPIRPYIQSGVFDPEGLRRWAKLSRQRATWRSARSHRQSNYCSGKTW